MISVLKKAIFFPLFLFSISFVFSQSDFYWVGGSGDWADYANHWVTSSGGTTYHSRKPGINDNVYFDENSFSEKGQKVDIGTDENEETCRDFIVKETVLDPIFQLFGAGSSLEVFGSLKIYGSINKTSDPNREFYFAPNMRSNSIGNVIILSGNYISGLTFKGNGEWTLLDDINIGSIGTQEGAPRIITNSKNIKANGITFASEGGLISLGRSIIETTAFSSSSANNSIIDKGESTIIIQNFIDAYSNAYFGLGSQELHIVKIGSKTRLYSFSSGKIDSLIIGGSLEIEGNTNNPPVEVKYLKINSSESNPLSFESNSTTNQIPISVSSGIVEAKWLNLKNTKVMGGATFNARYSNDLGGNTGWNITNGSVEADFLAFSLPEQTKEAIVDFENQSVKIEVALNSDFTQLIPKFRLSDGFAIASINGVEQISEVSVNDFTNPVTYTVTSADKSKTLEWLVTVTEDKVASKDVTCYLGSDGEISINSDQSHSYSIDGGISFGNNNTFTNLSAGHYNVVVKDANNEIVFEETVDINQPEPFFTWETISPTCYGDSDGQITLTVLNGEMQSFFEWFDGSTGLTKSNLAAGTYSLTATYGNCISDIEIEVKPDSLYSIPRIENICSLDQNGKIILSTIDGKAPYQYSIDGGISFQSENTFEGLSQGTYTILTRDANGCESTTEEINVTTASSPEATLIISGNTALCDGESLNLSTQEFEFYNWFKGNDLISNESSISITQPGNYYVEVGSNNCWSYSDTVRVDNIQTYQSQSICIVTYDNITGRNKIIWSKPNGEYISSYNIYRETGTNSYTLIGSVDHDSQDNFYIDNESNPLQASEKYKIRITDQCGNNSILSGYHKTFYLQVGVGLNNSVNLTWSNYEGFGYNQVNILRGSSYEDLQLLTTRPANNNTFTDTDPSADETIYVIEAISNYSCESDFSSRSQQSLAYTRSNIGDAKGIITGIIDDILDEVKIYPNPSSSKEIEIQSNNNLLLGGNIRILDLTGRELINGLKIDSNLTRISLGEISKQMILLEFSIADETFTKRVILQ